MKKTLISTLLLTLTSFLFSQETNGASYTANVGVTFTEGNSNTDQINVGFDVQKVTEDAELSLTSFYNYGRSTKTREGEEVNVTNLNKGKAELKGSHVISEDMYAYISLSIEKDDIAGIERRVAAGPGLGHYFRRDDIMTFSVEGGGVWVFEERDDSSDDYAALRIAQNLKWKLSEGAEIRQEIELIADIEEEENYFINAKLLAEATLTASLGLRVEVRDNYNNLPGEGKEQNDVTILSGVTVSW